MFKCLAYCSIILAVYFTHLFGLFGNVQEIISDDIVQTVQFVYQLAVAQPQTIKGICHQTKSIFSIRLYIFNIFKLHLSKEKKTDCRPNLFLVAVLSTKPGFISWLVNYYYILAFTGCIHACFCPQLGFECRKMVILKFRYHFYNFSFS